MTNSKELRKAATALKQELLVIANTLDTCHTVCTLVSAVASGVAVAGGGAAIASGLTAPTLAASAFCNGGISAASTAITSCTTIATRGTVAAVAGIGTSVAAHAAHFAIDNFLLEQPEEKLEHFKREFRQLQELSVDRDLPLNEVCNNYQTGVRDVLPWAIASAGAAYVSAESLDSSSRHPRASAYHYFKRAHKGSFAKLMQSAKWLNTLEVLNTFLLPFSVTELIRSSTNLLKGGTSKAGDHLRKIALALGDLNENMHELDKQEIQAKADKEKEELRLQAEKKIKALQLKAEEEKEALRQEAEKKIEVLQLKSENEKEAQRLKAEKEKEALRLKAEEEKALRLKAEKEKEALRLKAEEEKALRLKAEEEKALRLKAEEKNVKLQLLLTETNNANARQKAETTKEQVCLDVCAVLMDNNINSSVIKQVAAVFERTRSENRGAELAKSGSL